ncbi:MAG: hypothetical protein JJU29_14085 [Verrucomicrobia bacterium]|nr:hypothetical protein [Verrucomicrobiota bacterium]MCH8512184.1 hypothetical protein [Kiritimatiellia bacterium]
MIAISPLLFLVIFLVVIFLVVIFLVIRGRFLHIRRGHRPLAVRVVCGLLAFFLLAAMVHGHRAQIREAHASSPSDELHLPRQPAEFTKDALASGEFDLLVHMVAGTYRAQTFFPLEVREIRRPWPEGQNELQTLDMRPAGRDVQVTLRLGDIREWPRPRNQGMDYKVQAYISHATSEHSFGSSSRFISMPEVFQVFNRDRFHLPRHPYSPIPGGEIDLAAICVITPIAKNDPGQPVTMENFTAERAGEIHETLSRTRYSRGFSMDPGLFALIEWTGPQFFLLLLTAILGAQCFRQRGLGFTLCMTLLMICLVGMDKHHQSHHQRRSENEALATNEREIARQMTEVSFFFRNPQAP